MRSDPDALRELLETLHAELRRTDAVDEPSRELLRKVESDIQLALERSGSRHDSLIERLRETVEQFEGTHPALTTTVTRVLDALVSMGI